jgi:putative hydrolase of the HAD superfamily
MSATARGTILWDFDGTLVRMVRRWRYAVLDVLDSAIPGHQYSAEEIGLRLRAGYPWHTPERPHPGLNSPDEWWRYMESVFARSLTGLGLSAAEAVSLSASVRQRIIDPGAYEVYADTRPALARLQQAGWRHAIVSNHVPELDQLVTALGLRDWFDAVHTSASIGYEKPHRAIYSVALAAARAPALWMVGDSFTADVAGAERAGLRGILVRAQDPRAGRQAEDLSVAADIILAAAAGGAGRARGRPPVTVGGVHGASPSRIAALSRLPGAGASRGPSP